ncbi:MAG: heat-inducible transcription repressor HrcA [Christensenellaceae bacterium]|nr:heat-inducible transcription repressor HrcA [Christensenellaceae bacterium]
MKVTQRQLMILRAIIDDYILTGIPVGSRTLSKRADINVSSATIRNEMADLEEGGYLEQPHTSAGRLPSDKAYRLYVDTLMRVSNLQESEIRLIRNYFSNRMDQVEGIIDQAAKVLSDVTNMTSLVLAPQISRIEIKRIQIVKLSEGKALMLFVFDTGMVKDVMISIPRDMDSSYLEMLSNLLTEKVRSLKLHKAIEAVRATMGVDMSDHRMFLNEMLDAVQQNMQHRRVGKEVVLGGTKNIFNHPEYRDVNKAQNFLQLLETKDQLHDMLSRATDMEFTIRIGKENEIDQLKDMSVVTATYKIGDETLGSFGVIGPTRMNYSKVISVMRCVSASMNEIMQACLTEGGPHKDERK